MDQQPPLWLRTDMTDMILYYQGLESLSPLLSEVWSIMGYTTITGFAWTTHLCTCIYTTDVLLPMDWKVMFGRVIFKVLRPWKPVNPFMPIATKTTWLYFEDISLTIFIFIETNWRRNVDQELTYNSPSNTFQFMINLKVILKSISSPDDTCHGDFQAWMG